MAQLISWLQGSWHEVDGNEMKPEDVHYYMAFGGTGQNALQSEDVLNVMCHPVILPFADEQLLQVENVQTEATPDGARRIFFSVRNVGSELVASYKISIMLLRP